MSNKKNIILNDTITSDTFDWQFFKAVSWYRCRNFEKCVEMCNFQLEFGQRQKKTPNQIQHHMKTRTRNYSTNNASGGGGEIVFNERNQGKQFEKFQTAQTPGDSGNEAAANAKSINNNSSERNGSNLLNMPTRQLTMTTTTGPSFARLPTSLSLHPSGKANANASALPNNPASRTSSSIPMWMIEGVWQLKMRALTQRIYIDDLETNDADDTVNEELEFERIATMAHTATSIKTAFTGRRSTLVGSGYLHSKRGLTGYKTSNSSITVRPSTGMAHPGIPNGQFSRCGTASRIRSNSARVFSLNDPTANLYQGSRLNPTIYAEDRTLVKALFQFLYYHESDVKKAFTLCEAVLQFYKRKPTNRFSAPVKTLINNDDEWWWYQQIGRCLLTLRCYKRAEKCLLSSLNAFQHPDTYLLLSRLYQRQNKEQQALDLIQAAIDKHPFNGTYRLEQGRLLDRISKSDESFKIYRLITKLNPINIEALACIALHYFYDNNPELALMYYRRILSLGVHTAELYCNIALCCLFGGQIELVLPCFQRSLAYAKSSEQKASIWYNISFVAITTGDFTLANRCLQLSLKSAPQNGAALNNLAVLSVYGGDSLKAKSYLNAAKELLPESTEIDNNVKYIEQLHNQT